MLRIHFEDRGQDILWWDIDENGIVQDCNLQHGVWVGTLVQMSDQGLSLSNMKPGAKLYCVFKTGVVGTFNHLVSKIEKAKGEENNRGKAMVCPIHLSPIHCPNCYFRPDGECRHAEMMNEQEGG